MIQDRLITIYNAASDRPCILSVTARLFCLGYTHKVVTLLCTDNLCMYCISLMLYIYLEVKVWFIRMCDEIYLIKYTHDDKVRVCCI